MAGTSKKTSTKYFDILKRSQEEVDLETLQHDTEEASIQMDRDILSAKAEITARTKALASARGARPFNSANVLVAKRQLEKAQKDFEDLTALKAEMF